MEIRHLLKSQSNEVFEAIKNAGLEPTDFDWQDATGHASMTRVSRLVHKGSGYYFMFDNLGGFNSKWESGQQTRVDSWYWDEWLSQLDCFRSWLSDLKRETESQDLWGAISKEAQILESAASSDTSNAPFTLEENAYVFKASTKSSNIF
jgi:hypothetical protein